MVRVPYREDHLNFFRFTYIVTNNISEALRQTFKRMWDRKFGPLLLWDDSEAVRKKFAANEGSTSKIPTQQSYEEWDCTALFQATIFAHSFALPDSTGHYKTLSDLYVKPLGLPRGHFHATVMSSRGDDNETFALAIDQLRILRNLLSHLHKGEMSKGTFNQYLQHVKDAFKALGLKTDEIDSIGSEFGFPTSEVADLERKNANLERRIQNSYMVIGVGAGVVLLK